MSISVIIVFCLTAAAVFLGIINWVHLLSISSKASELEQEINKKAQEFDNFKKEKISFAPVNPVIEVDDTPVQEAVEPQLSTEPIQIMRNVGGSFERAEKHIFKPAEYKTSSSGINLNVPEISPEPQVFTERISQADPAQFSSSDQFAADSEVLATVNDQPETDSHLPLAVFQLYSESAKDADFNSLWKNISGLLQSNIKSEIGIDFTGINFLYDKELTYLSKIHQIVASAGSKILFLNCDPELIIIISKFTELSPLILKKNL